MKGSRRIKHALVFNDLWKGICDGDTPKKSTDSNELVVWQHKNDKALALIGASIIEEVNRHMNILDNR